MAADSYDTGGGTTHKVNNIQQLYDDACTLYNNEVIGNGDTIISNLKKAISTLSECWKGVDAGKQINNIVTVYNGMVALRNVLASVCEDTSMIAAKYRNIQIAGGGSLEELTPLSFEPQTTLEPYSDTNDTVNIDSRANTGKAAVDSANNTIDTFVSNVKLKLTAITDNWQSGPKRDNAVSAIEQLNSASATYKEKLQEVSVSIATALQNYANFM